LLAPVLALVPVQPPRVPDEPAPAGLSCYCSVPAG